MAAAFSELLYIVVVVVVAVVAVVVVVVVVDVAVDENIKAGQLLNFILQVRSSSVARKSLRELLHEFYGLTLAYEEVKWWYVTYSM